MRKFILKKKPPSSTNYLPSPSPVSAASSSSNLPPRAGSSATYTADRSSHANEAPNPHHDYKTPTPDANDQLLALENRKLKEATQSLITENLKLKEKISRLEASKRESAAREPSWPEAKQLIQMITKENDYLLKHIREEQGQLHDLKSLQIKEIEQLSQQLEECQLNKNILEQKYQTIRLEYDKLQAEVKLMTEDLSQVVPIGDHQQSIRRCQAMLHELRALYHKELTSLNENADASHSQLRAVCLEVAKLNAELAESKRRNDLLRKECADLRVGQAALQSELSAAVHGKVQAERTLRELLTVFEKKNTK